jgi:Cys-rich repeat protein
MKARLAAAALLFAACFPVLTGAPCSSNAECPTGQVCTAGKCANDPGAGGGAAGGDGGGSAGGGAAGGGMGGGSAGGSGGAGGGGVDAGTDGGVDAGLPYGAECLTAAQCSSGACTQFYRDNDRDLRGGSIPEKRCGVTADAGYATTNDDCCDYDARAWPGQTMFFDTPRDQTCGNSYDFDCNGVEEREPLDAGRCPPPMPPPNQPPMCNVCAYGLGWAMAAPMCGMQAPQVTSVGGAPSAGCPFTVNMLMNVAPKCR